MGSWPMLKLIGRRVVQVLHLKRITEPLNLPSPAKCGRRRKYLNLHLPWLLHGSHLFDLMAEVSFRLSVQCAATEDR